MKVIRWIILALTTIFTAVLMFVLPNDAVVPVHFDINGDPDRFGSKYEMLIMPIIVIATMILLEILIKKYKNQAANETDEKKKAEFLSNANVMNITAVITSVFFLAITAMTYYIVYSNTFENLVLPEISVINVIGVLMGALFIALANYMPKTRKNRNIGLRLPWSWYNDTTWKKSNKFASYLMIIVGIVCIIASLFVNETVAGIIIMVSVILAIILMTVYAYTVYREERKKENEATDKE
jgi:uncharacterized membrane protein